MTENMFSQKITLPNIFANIMCVYRGEGEDAVAIKFLKNKNCQFFHLDFLLNTLLLNASRGLPAGPPVIYPGSAIPLSLRNRQNAFPDKNFDFSIITAVLNELEIGVFFGLLSGMHTHVVFYKRSFPLSP